MEAYSPHPRFVFHCNPGCSTTAHVLQCHCTWVAVKLQECCSNAARQVAVNITTTIHRCKASIARLVIN